MVAIVRLSSWIAHVLLGLDRLVQPVGPPPAGSTRPVNSSMMRTLPSATPCS